MRRIPKVLYTTVLNINGKNANDGTAVFDLESIWLAN